MSASDPPIIQGDHPFKVEAVLSKTGGINALAKRAPAMKASESLGPDHREILPPESHTGNANVHLDANAAHQENSDGPTLQDQYDTSHREQFDDPSRRLRTDQRIKIPLTTRGSSDSSNLHPLAEASARAGSDGGKTTPRPSNAAGSADSVPHPHTLHGSSTASTAQMHAQRQHMQQRIEQIKSNNESVEKNLAALEKMAPAQTPHKPTD